MNITRRTVRAARRRGLTVLTHRQWGAQHKATYRQRRRDTSAGRWGQYVNRADTVVQHITVTRRTGDFAADARTVEQIGYERFGSGVSYNFLVDMVTGEVAVGQPLDSKGTHTINDKHLPGYSYDQNLVARAIAVIGMPGDPLSTKAGVAIARLLAAMIETGAITRTFDYRPHSAFTDKDCPCDATRSRMAVIRRAAAHL